MRDANFVSISEAQTAQVLDLRAEADVHQLYSVAREEAEMYRDNWNLAREALAELELALEDEGWRRLGLEGEREFSRSGLDKIISMARVMYLKNPLIQGGVETRAYYIWGQGVEISARDETVNEVIQAFMNDKGNRKEFTRHASQVAKEIKLASEGNVFFTLFPDSIKGTVKLRSLPTQEVRDIYLNPEDKNEVHFYYREWTEDRKNMTTGAHEVKTRKAYYPDVNYDPDQKPASIGNIEIKWDSPVYHVKIGGFDDMRFGLPETYAALDWARAYKSFLEDWATLFKAISRYAWKVTKKKKSQIQATRERLETTVTRSTVEDNPPPTSGAYWIEGEDTNLQPINKSGATTSPTDGKLLRLMIGASLHLPDTILSSDPQQGALATAKTLDRPTELAMLDRQAMWKDVFIDLFTYVVRVNLEATSPTLRIAGGVTDDGEIRLTSDEPLNFDITFPPIVERDLDEYIGAIVTAMTLDGKAEANVAPKDLFRRLILSALGVRDIDDIIEEMTDEEEGPQPEEEALRFSKKDWASFIESLGEVMEQNGNGKVVERSVVERDEKGRIKKTLEVTR